MGYCFLLKPATERVDGFTMIYDDLREAGHRESKSWCRSHHFDPTDAKAAGRWLSVFGLGSQQHFSTSLGEFQWL